MMSRTQISLDPELLRRARRRATERGLSLAAYLRTLLTRDLGEDPRTASPSLVFDLGGSGGSDVARDKDAMIGEAVERRRKP